jgi:cyclic pyranopterin phosphate synthase
MNKLTHLDEAGAARMVDISAKLATRREAVAQGSIAMNATALAAIRDSNLAKGDALATARLAGIMAAKRTADLIPLCHPLPLDAVTLDLALDDTGITATASVITTHGTGVEMEAMTAVSIALLTVYDMAKALDKAMVIGPIRLLKKTGGKSGPFVAPPLP